MHNNKCDRYRQDCHQATNNCNKAKLDSCVTHLIAWAGIPHSKCALVHKGSQMPSIWYWQAMWTCIQQCMIWQQNLHWRGHKFVVYQAYNNNAAAMMAQPGSLTQDVQQKAWFNQVSPELQAEDWFQCDTCWPQIFTRPWVHLTMSPTILQKKAWMQYAPHACLSRTIHSSEEPERQTVQWHSHSKKDS